MSERSIPAADLATSVSPLLEAIRLAPSAHNTQPWFAHITGPDRLKLSVNLDRWLDVSDPDGEQIAYSLGCAIEAASSVASLECVLNRDADVLREGSTICELIAKGDPSSAALEELRTRQTDRRPYRRAKIAPEQIERLKSAAESAGAELRVCSGRAEIRRVARLAAGGAATLLENEKFVVELLDWLRLSPAERRRAPDGFTPETLALDPVSAWLMRCLRASPTARRLALRAGLPRALGWVTATAVRRSGALGLLAVRDSNLSHWIEGGRALMRVWLAASRAGLAFQPVHFPLTTETGRNDCARLFGASAGMHSVTVVRIGYGFGPAACADRLSVREFVTSDLSEPTLR